MAEASLLSQKKANREEWINKAKASRFESKTMAMLLQRIVEKLC
jgi:hypothetical protein